MAAADACAEKLKNLDLKTDSSVPAAPATLSYAAVAGRANSDAKSPSKDSPSDGEDSKKSMLSAEAAEFVPRWLQSPDSAAAPKPTASPSVPVAPQTDAETDFAAVEPASSAEYRSFAEKVVKSPNQADEILPGLLVKLGKETAEARSSALRGICALIVNHAASDHGARHAMGRMINVLLQTVSQTKSEMGSDFWSALNAQFHREHENSAKTLAENPGRYKTFAFFLAEVLGNSARMFGHQRADELSDLLLLVLEDFFRTEDGEQWKVAGQVLKQVGAYLEDNFARRKDSTGLSDMDRFMITVDTRGHSGREDIPFYIRSMLINIMELRAYNWGRSCSPSEPSHAAASATVSAPSQVIPNYNSHNDDDDGFEMSLNSEERRFLESEGCFFDEGGDDEDGMDEEMERDYELFLQMSSNGQ